MNLDLSILPKDKFDIEAAEALLEYEPEQLIALIPELIYYIADMNWPVAEVMTKVLSHQSSQNLIPHFVRIFYSSELIDSDLKRNILYFINNFFKLEDILLIKTELILLANYPSKFDLDEGVTEIAQIIVAKHVLS